MKKKWFWMRPKPTLDKMHNILVILAMKKRVLDAFKSLLDKAGQSEKFSAYKVGFSTLE